MIFLSISEHTQTLDIVGPTNTDSIDLDRASNVSIQCNVTVDTPAAQDFGTADTNVSANTITIADHGFTTGIKGQFTTDDTLPAGITTSVDYFLIVVDENTIKVAASLILALAGTAIDLTDQGSADTTNTFTPTALAGATIVFQKSNDGVHWANDGSPTSVTTTASFWFEQPDPTPRYCRIYSTLTAGHMTTDCFVLVKGFI